jgi:hypothetical protein
MGSGRFARNLCLELRVEQEADLYRTDLHLLARVRFRNADGEEREFFASIIELGPRSGRIESGRALEKGSPIQLHVVFPRQREYANRHVQLNYVVRGPHDEPNLIYDIDATEMDRETRERLSRYLRRE